MLGNSADVERLFDQLQIVIHEIHNPKVAGNVLHDELVGILLGGAHNVEFFDDLRGNHRLMGVDDLLLDFSAFDPFLRFL